jgi:photosystem II stability/assembly factor-like uncharacterized protein
MGMIYYTPDGTKAAWQQQAKGLTKANLNAVSADSDEDEDGNVRTWAWVVGDGGTILHGIVTNDGKTSAWQLLGNKKLPKANLNAVFFMDEDHGWAVGDNGTIVSYDSNSKTGWTARVAPPGTPNLYAVFFMEIRGDIYGWAAGDVRTTKDKEEVTTVIMTTDGGKNWKFVAGPKADPANAKKVYAARGLAFSKDPVTGAIAGWLVGDKSLGIWVSENYGRRWTNGITDKLKLKGLNISGGLRTVKAFDPKDVWAVGGETGVVFWNGTKWGGEAPNTSGPWQGGAFLRKTALSGKRTTLGWLLSPTGGISFSPNAKGGNWSVQKRNNEDKEPLNAIEMFFRLPSPGVKLSQGTSPESGSADVNYVSVIGWGFPEGNINPANVLVELATECHGPASASTSAVSIVSGPDDSELLSFLLPGGLAPGQYFVSISDSEEGDANFESSNCSAVNVVQ